MLAVEVERTDELRVQRPKLLFELPGLHEGYDVARDREGFLMIRHVINDSPDERRIEVALNWTERLARGN